mgnify:FL=1
MNRKRRSKICCLSGILLLILLLAGVQRVSAMTTRTELYQNTPSDGGRSGGKEKQLLANSYAGEYQIDFSYGFEGNYQDGNHVPIRVTITNESAVEFEGYFVFQIKKRRGIDLPQKQWRRHSLKTVSGGQAVGRWKKQPFYVPFSNLYSGERNRYKDFFCRASGGKYVFLCPAPGEQPEGHGVQSGRNDFE